MIRIKWPFIPEGHTRSVVTPSAPRRSSPPQLPLPPHNGTGSERVKAAETCLASRPLIGCRRRGAIGVLVQSDGQAPLGPAPPTPQLRSGNVTAQLQEKEVPFEKKIQSKGKLTVLICFLLFTKTFLISSHWIATTMNFYSEVPSNSYLPSLRSFRSFLLN